MGKGKEKGRREGSKGGWERKESDKGAKEVKEFKEEEKISEMG